MAVEREQAELGLKTCLQGQLSGRACANPGLAPPAPSLHPDIAIVLAMQPRAGDFTSQGLSTLTRKMGS